MSTNTAYCDAFATVEELCVAAGDEAQAAFNVMVKDRNQAVTGCAEAINRMAEMLRHLIGYVRSNHDHLHGIENPQVDSLMVEAHLMELLGRCHCDPEQPIRYQLTGYRLRMEQLHKTERELYARIDELEDDVDTVIAKSLRDDEEDDTYEA